MQQFQNKSATEQEPTNGGAQHVKVQLPVELHAIGEGERVAMAVLLEAIVKALLAILFRKK